MKSLRILPVGLSVFAVALAGCSAPADDDHGAVSDDAKAAWEDAYEQVEMGKADSTGCSGVVVPDKNGFDKHVALTFDDGPNPETTPTVLDILKAHGIHGTFFVNGMRVNSDAARAVLGRILAEGHILANHSQHHLNLKTQSISKVDQEVKSTHDILLAAGDAPKYFRFPFGSASCGGIDLVHNYGYTVTGWHIDTGDWCFASSAGGVGYCSPSTFKYVPDEYRSDLEGYAISEVKKKNGGIVLFHDIHQNTVNHLDSIISKLEAEGFSFVLVSDTDTFPLLNGITPPPKPFVGDPCTSDADCGFSNGSETGSCYLFTPSGGTQQTGFCTLACEGVCPDSYGKAPTFCTSLDGGQSGNCVSKQSSLNGECSAIPGTSAQTADRFIGSSSATASSAMVCLPN